MKFAGLDLMLLSTGVKNGRSLQGKLADGTVVEIEAGASFYTDPISDMPAELPVDSVGGQSEAKPPVFNSPRKLGTHLSTHRSRVEGLSRPCPARE
ncbi:hypothetical protein TNCV_2674451 [Trichonephila clavipes]|nr:hypothetical protein TNCV_2674451 [Trichonephila clavipes]